MILEINASARVVSVILPPGNGYRVTSSFNLVHSIPFFMCLHLVLSSHPRFYSVVLVSL